MPGTRFFTAPSMTDQPAGTSISCSFPLCSIYLIFGMGAPSYPAHIPRRPCCGQALISADGFHRDRCVGKTLRRDACLFGNELAADQIFRRGVDGFDGGHAALAQMED